MTTEISDRLRSDLPRLADHLLADATPADLPLLPVRSSRPPARRWLVAAAAVVVMVLVAGVALVARPDDQRPATTTTSTETTVPPGTWRAIAQPGLSPREDAPSVWTGREWLVFGGRDGIRAFADGAAYDPSTDRWRSLSPPIDMHPGAQALWTGRLAVVLAKQGGWTYDPETDTWADLPLQGGTGQVVFASTAVWIGHDVVVIGYGDDLETLSARILDPDDRSWGPVTPSPRIGPLGHDAVDGLPAGSAVAGARWDGSQVQVWLEDGSGWAFDPVGRGWSKLRSIVGPHDDPEAMLAITGVGSTTYALLSTAMGATTSHQLGRFDDGGWTLVGPSQDGPTADVDCQLTAAGGSVVRFCARSGPARIDPSTGEVRPYDDPAVGGGTGRSLAWTGSELLVFGGRDAAPLGTTGELNAQAVALTP